MPGHRLQIGEHGDVYYSRRGDRVTASLYYRSHDGRRRRIEATAATKTAARRKALDVLKRRVDSGTASYSPRTTFGNLAHEWLAHLDELAAVGRRSPSTVALYRHALERQVLPGIGQLRLAELTPARLDHFLHQKRREKGYATAKLCRAICSGVCGVAVRHGALVTNPVRDVSGLEVDRSREARALTVDEAREWLAILDSDPLAVRKDLGDLARFLLGTGCRLGEAVGAHWAGVDFDRHVLRGRRTVLRVKGRGLVAKTPKSRAGVRTLRLPLWLVAVLRERRGDAGDDSPIFPDARGGYRDGNNIEKDFRKVRAGTPFEWVVPHTYRKTVATMLDASGLSARVIADQLGHSRMPMTQDVDMGRRAVDEAVATALEGVVPNPDDPDDDGPATALRAVL
jgi:integrase